MSAVTRPPGPKARYPFAHAAAFRRDFASFLHETRQQYGDIAYFQIATRKMYLISDAEAVRDIFVTNHRNFTKSLGLQLAGQALLGEGLLTAEGDTHRRNRRMLQPAFHTQRIAAYGDVMQQHTERMCRRWQSGATYDIDEEMMRLTMSIVGKTLFDADVEVEAGEVGGAIDDMMGHFGLIGSPLAPLAPLVLKFGLPIPGLTGLKKSRERIDATIYRMIEERKQSGEDRGDLLSMLLAAVDEEDGAGLSTVGVRDEAVTLFLAGHETTANALTWSYYLLSQHPGVRERMHEEVREVLGGEPITAARVRELPFTRQVFAEAMRLYPPAHVIGRINIEPFECLGYTIPAGSTIFISPYALHRHERYWPEPGRFDPDRFTPEAIEQRPKHAYIPFGGGPRVCIGEPFAWMEGVIVLATIAQHYRLDLDPAQEIALRPLITLRPKHGMRMQTEAVPRPEPAPAK